MIAAHSLVVRLMAKPMRPAVDAEGDVESDAKAAVEHDPEGQPQGLVPEVPRHQDGDGDRADGEKDHKVLFLEHDDRIGFEVPHVDHLPLGHHRRMRRQHHPTDVRKEEPPIAIVRIGVRLGELVMHAVVMGPRIGISLKNTTTGTALLAAQTN